jgi:ABC-2 type transport system permease protein
VKVVRHWWARARFLVKVELDRLGHSRTSWILAAAMLVVGALVALGTTSQAGAAAGGAEGGGSGGAGPSSAGLAGVAGLRIFVVLIGVLCVTSEYHHGEVVWRFLAEPSRTLFVVTKAGACAVVGALLGLVAVQTASVLSLVLATPDGGLGLSATDASQAVVGSVLAAALGGVLGVGIGAAVRNQTAAVVGTLVAVLVVEPVISVLVPSVARFLPTAAAAVAAGDTGALGWNAGLALCVVYAAAALLVGGLLCARRDV